MPPGEEGTIKIKVNTNGFGGHQLKKTIQVETNDNRYPKFNLVVTGYVEKFVTILPERIKLAGQPQTLIKTSVSIIPEEKFPFKILEVTAKTGINIRQDLQETEISTGKKGYLLTVENLKKETGRYFDTITLKTDSKIRPEIAISVYGNIFQNIKK
ncbi:MAG: hypothetical protein C0403_05075 [Desulfobacterium sp.]|nr:hypothetical protein [Desulfobacterium sp.]